MDRYLSHHSGEEMDEVVSMVRNHGLGKLEHDMGIFVSSDKLPTSAVNGNYAYVGTDYSAMALYVYQNGWGNTFTTVDLYQRNNVLMMDTADTAEYNDVF